MALQNLQVKLITFIWCVLIVALESPDLCGWLCNGFIKTDFVVYFILMGITATDERERLLRQQLCTLGSWAALSWAEHLQTVNSI